VPDGALAFIPCPRQLKVQLSEATFLYKNKVIISATAGRYRGQRKQFFWRNLDMLNQKKLSLLIAAGLAVSLSAFPVFADDAPPAGPPPGDPPPANHEHGPRQSMLDRLETQLKLTDDQKTTVDPILKDAQSQINTIRENKDLAREDKRTQTLAVIEGLPDKLNPTLNDDQKATLAKFVDRMKNPPQRGQGGQHGGRGGHGGGQHGGQGGPQDGGDNG
jgi:hypothetical protein